MEYGSPAASRQDKCRLAGARRLQYCCCLFPCEATMHGTGDSLSRRDWLAVMGAAGAGAVLPPGLSQAAPPGRATAQLRKRDDFIEGDVTAEMDQPIKAVPSVIRGLPRGQISAAGNEPFDPRDNELLFGYPFNGGDLFGANTAWGLSTPLVIVQRAEGDCVFVSSLDDRVRAKRFFLQPGEPAYRLEAVFEAEGWKDQTTLRVPTWRLGRTASLDAAVQAHYGHLERAYHP